MTSFSNGCGKGGALGKVADLALFLVEFAPPIFNGYAIYVLFIQLYPTATTLTERLAVLGILVALANAEVLWLRNVLIQGMVFAYANRRRGGRRGLSPSVYFFRPLKDSAKFQKETMARPPIHTKPINRKFGTGLELCVGGPEGPHTDVTRPMMNGWMLLEDGNKMNIAIRVMKYAGIASFLIMPLFL